MDAQQLKQLLEERDARIEQEKKQVQKNILRRVVGENAFEVDRNFFNYASNVMAKRNIASTHMEEHIDGLNTVYEIVGIVSVEREEYLPQVTESIDILKFYYQGERYSMLLTSWNKKYARVLQPRIMDAVRDRMYEIRYSVIKSGQEK